MTLDAIQTAPPEVLVLYEPTDPSVGRFAASFVDMASPVYPDISAHGVASLEALKSRLGGPAEILVYFFHGEPEGIRLGEAIVPWPVLGAALNRTSASHHVLAVCYSSGLRPFVSSEVGLHTIRGLVDGKILMVNALFALSAILAESGDDEERRASEVLTRRAIEYFAENLSEFFARALLPKEPLAFSLPASSGYSGPVGYIIDAVLDAVRQSSATLEVGGSYQAGFSRSGFGGSGGGVTASFNLDWGAALTVPSDGRLEGSISIEFSSDQPGLPGSLLDALGGVTITVIGEGEFALEVVSEPVNRVEVESWRLSLKIIISKEIGFFDLLRVIFPAAAVAVERLPSKIENAVKKALNRVIVEPYLGAEFVIFSNAVGDDEFELTVFFGVTAYTRIPVVKLSAGFGVDLEFHFTDGGNFFVLSLMAEFKADVPWPFKDLKKTWKRSWQIGPGSSSGEQMNRDSDDDGLGDDFESSIGTSPTSADTDSDGLEDGVEITEYRTAPTDPDSDDDGLSDGAEVAYFLDAFTSPLGDEDGDGRPNVLDPDSDNDGLMDGEEVNGVSVVVGAEQFTFFSDPLAEDTDGDGLSDATEVRGVRTILVDGQSRTVYANPEVQDSDGDTLFDLEEVEMNSDPLREDTDGDGLWDDEERNIRSTAWDRSDSDGDGLTDGEEVLGVLPSDPLRVDTDGDGLTDFQEVRGVEIILNGTPVTVTSDPRSIDSDTDGVSDHEEVILGEDARQTLPLNSDTDGDGLPDNEFFLYGADPTDPDSDDDGLDDGGEVTSWSSDPISADTDSDGLGDKEEIDYFRTWDAGFGPTSDYDGDGLAGILDFDSDDGGVGDGDEKLDGTVDPTNKGDDSGADSDRDEMPNLWEQQFGLDPNNAADNSTDIDSPSPDGLTNLQEYRSGTSPLDPDTDGDGLSDGDEVLSWQSDPLRADSDGDGIEDLVEINYFRQPAFDPGFSSTSDYDADGLKGIMDPDSDGDALLDGSERNLTFESRVTDPTDPDTDLDTLSDGDEVLTYRTDPTRADTDLEGLLDPDEIFIHGTDPLRPDTDGDGLTDAAEVLTWGSSPLEPDSDRDGITDGNEVAYFTALDPAFGPSSNYDFDALTGIMDPDSDTDHLPTLTGLEDGEELARGTDPRVRDSDADLLDDYVEARGYGFQFADGSFLIYFTDPLNPDTDADGLLDGEEVLPTPINFRNMSYDAFTNPMDPDTDGDGLGDGREVMGIPITVMGQNMTVITNPMHPDTDEDRISDLEEITGWNWHLSSNFPVRDREVTGTVGLEAFEEAGPPLDVEAPTQTYFTKVAALRGGYITDPVDPDTDDDGLGDGAEKYDAMFIPNVLTPNRLIEARTMPLLTIPVDPDTDGDGLLDGEEANVHHTNPRIRDTDRDGLNDTEEVVAFATDPLSYDTDRDQLSDRYETLMTYPNATLPVTMTDPNDPDTDRDGLPDGYEVFFWSTHPLNNDTDEDRLADGDEVFRFGTDPFLSDSDSDLLDDYDEALVYATEPLEPDTDLDGIPDGVEVHFYGTDPLRGDENADGVLDGWDRDFDDDGLSDYEETVLYRTNMNETDTDGDGLLDGAEKDYLESWGAAPGGDPDRDGLPNLFDTDSDNDGLTDDAEFEAGTNPARADTDGDGLGDFEEITELATDPTQADTDADGVLDAAELARGTNPLSSDSDGDLWGDGADLAPQDVFLPNAILIIPLAVLLGLGIYFRGRIVPFLRRLTRKQG